MGTTLDWRERRWTGGNDAGEKAGGTQEAFNRIVLSELPTVNPRIVLSGPPSSEIYQEMLAKALAHYYGAKLLIFDSHSFLVVYQMVNGLKADLRGPTSGARGLKVDNFWGSWKGGLCDGGYGYFCSSNFINFHMHKKSSGLFSLTFLSPSNVVFCYLYQLMKFAWIQRMVSSLPSADCQPAALRPRHHVTGKNQWHHNRGSPMCAGTLI
ncbi:hypothetical protein L1987_56815 [Smallanthus sonchifolius]|uniref:Uncharacterized protein n=1 Tax=Smallanthus sonchifolius TaxID=185202 RepID=A0ACB9DB92_9ASTR|nr:hypothetical protein L1987_56815 [Smallanthus sonchifolius]